MSVSTALAAVLAGGAIVAMAPLRRRALPVAKALGRAGAGVATAIFAGIGDIAQAAWRGQPHPEPPATT